MPYLGSRRCPRSLAPRARPCHYQEMLAPGLLSHPDRLSRPRGVRVSEEGHGPRASSAIPGFQDAQELPGEGHYEDRLVGVDCIFTVGIIRALPKWLDELLICFRTCMLRVWVDSSCIHHRRWDILKMKWTLMSSMFNVPIFSRRFIPRFWHLGVRKVIHGCSGIRVGGCRSCSSRHPSRVVIGLQCIYGVANTS